MPEKLSLNIPLDVLDHARVELHINYGIAMDRWAGVERAMFFWFKHLTGMTEDVASAIFYSPRGFYSQTEMLESLLDAIDLDSFKEIEIKILMEGLKKARKYSAFRNKLVHGDRRLNYLEKRDGTGEAHFTIVQAKMRSRPNQEEISIKDMQAAANNFTSLNNAMLYCLHPYSTADNAKSPQECLALILALPNEANSKNVPTPAEPETQPRSGRRNKKAYRAAQRELKPRTTE